MSGPTPIRDVLPLLEELEAYDTHSATHTWRVTLYARAVAEAAGIDMDRIARISVGASLHDVGKLDVPHAILTKPGRLTEAEFKEIKKHPVRGYDRLRAMGVTDDVVLDLVRSHHERLDGTGYPDGLSGDEIPRPAKYFAVVDTFDALTSVRPYRREIGPDAAERALTIIREGAGSHFDPEAVAFFEEVYRSGVVEWVLHYYNDDRDVGAFDLGKSLQMDVGS